MADFAVPSRQQAESEATHEVPGSRSEAAPSRARRAAARLRPSAVPALPAAAVQPALRLGPEGDRYERDAEFHTGAAASGPAGPGVSRADGVEGTPVDAAVTRLILGAKGRGHPLPETVRDRYEPALGTDLAPVRLHTGSLADRLNAGFQSSAFTVGHDIFFRDGAYDPAHGVGGDVLSHELHHVAQQKNTAALLIQRMSKKSRASTNKRKADGKAEKEASKSEEETSKAEEETNQPSDTKKNKTKKARGPLFNVPTIPFNQMKSNLEKEFGEPKQQRPSEGSPDGLLIGAIVWNVNHLGAPKSRKGRDGITAPAPTSPAPGEEVAERAGIKQQVAKITMNMAAIREVLTPIAPKPKATDKAGEAPEEEEANENEERVTKGQIETDVAALVGADSSYLSMIITSGLVAKAEQARGGKQTTEERSIQLRNLRRLNQVWMRLKRIQNALSPQAKTEPEPESETKRKLKAKRKAERKAEPKKKTIVNNLPDDQQAILAANIEKIFGLHPATQLKDTVDNLKRTWIVDQIEKFFRNPNIHIVLLNEVNLGIDYLRQELHARDPRLEVSTGPIMLAKGREVTEGSKAKGKTETTLNGKDVNVTGSQHEYYAAVYRKADKTKDDGGVTLQGTFYIGTDGMFIEQERPGEKQEKSKTNNAISWNKAKDAEFGQSFRGVVVHRFLQHGQELWSAVIHTTPAGHGLDRKEIWPQIKKPLAELNSLAKEFGIPVLIGGDYYISAEAIVDNPAKPKRRKKNVMEAQESAIEERSKKEPTKEEQVAAQERNQELRENEFWFLASDAFHQAGRTKKMSELFEKLRWGGRNPKLIEKLRRSREDAISAELEEKQQRQAEDDSEKDEDLISMMERRDQEIAAEYIDQADESKKGSEPSYFSLRPEYNRLVSDWLAAQPAKDSWTTSMKKFKALVEKIGITPEWQQTLAGGRITEEQFFRATGATGAITLEKALKQQEYGYRIVGGVGPTNPKDKGKFEDKAQVADFFLVNNSLPIAIGGIPDPETGEIVTIDKDKWPWTNIYWGGSDHGPQAVVVSTGGYKRAAAAIRIPKDADEFASLHNLESWSKMESRLREFTTAGRVDSNVVDPTVHARIATIKELLKAPALAPDEQIVARVTRIAKFLFEHLSANYTHRVVDADRKAWNELLDDIEKWSAIYGLDFSADKLGQAHNEGESKTDTVDVEVPLARAKPKGKGKGKGKANYEHMEIEWE